MDHVAEAVQQGHSRAAEVRADHDRRQHILAAQTAGSFCPDPPRECPGWVYVEETETQCPYEGSETLATRLWDLERVKVPDGLCPHWVARQHEQHYRALLAHGFGEEAAAARWSKLPPEIEKGLRLYCRTLPARLRAGDGLIVTGPVGGGKTCALGLIAVVAMEAMPFRGGVCFVETSELTEWLATPDRAEEVHMVENAGLLLLDDLGTEYAHARTESKLNRLINLRWGRRRSTVVMTNLTKEDLTGGGRLARLLDRLAHRAPWLAVTRQSQRTPVRLQDWEAEDDDD